MIPGPVELAPEVLTILAEPLWAHYGDRWVALWNETVAQTRRVFQTENDLFIMPGSGTLGLDACLASTLGGGGKALVLCNGFFGHRLKEMAQAYTPDVVAIETRWGAPLPLDRVQQAIGKERPRLVALAHCETSTCMLNPVEPVGAWCQEHGALLLVDAISSLGGAALPVDAWGVDLCVSATQKALGCPPGLALVSVGQRAWAVMDRHPALGWYQNLTVWKRYAQEWGQWFPHPVTQNSGLVRALHWSTRAILEEGLESCHARHLNVRDQLRDRVRAWGLGLLIPDEHASPLVTAVVLDGRITPQTLVQRLKNDHGILIGGGLGSMADSVVRIGHMGPQATPERMGPLFEALGEVFA